MDTAPSKMKGFSFGNKAKSGVTQEKKLNEQYEINKSMFIYSKHLTYAKSNSFTNYSKINIGQNKS